MSEKLSGAYLSGASVFRACLVHANQTFDTSIIAAARDSASILAAARGSASIFAAARGQHLFLPQHVVSI